MGMQLGEGGVGNATRGGMGWECNITSRCRKGYVLYADSRVISVLCNLL